MHHQLNQSNGPGTPSATHNLQRRGAEITSAPAGLPQGKPLLGDLRVVDSLLKSSVHSGDPEVWPTPHSNSASLWPLVQGLATSQQGPSPWRSLELLSEIMEPRPLLISKISLAHYTCKLWPGRG